jgi:hypothetical protein
MNDVVTIITELGFPIAAAIGLGMFVWKLINRIIDGMETKLDTVDEKVNTSLTAMEGRLGTDTMIKTMLGVPQLIDTNKIAKARRNDKRKD